MNALTFAASRGTPSAAPRGLLAVTAKDDLSDPAVALAAINRTFEEFKAAHAEQLRGVEKRFDDVVSRDKLDRVDARLAEITAAVDKLATDLSAFEVNGRDRPQAHEETEAQRKYRADFHAWIQTGDGESGIRAAGRNPEIVADASVGTSSDGGYTVPVEWDRTITDKRREVSPMRRYASVQPVRGQGFKRLFTTGGTTTGWVAETAARPKTDGSVFAEYAYSFGELYAQPAASQRILDDSEIDFEAWLAGEVNTTLAQQEGTAFVSGNGTDKPKGVLNYSAADEAALAASLRHPLGPITEVVSGAAAALTADGLIDLVYDLPEDRSQGAALYANRKTHATIRKMKDGDGTYLWQPPFQAGQPAQVLGAPVRELTGLPDVAADAIPLLYGNMAETYRIFDRLGMRLLRDPYTSKPWVLFYTTVRVGGGLWNPEWMRYHRVAAA